MEIVSQIAPEVDRLVLSTNGRVNAEHGERILEVARENGIDNTTLVSTLGPFLAGGRLTEDLASLRMRYMAPEVLHDHLRQLDRGGHLQDANGSLQAGPKLSVVLQTRAEALREVTTDEWGDQTETVEGASAVARRVAEAADADHVVAVVHRELSEPDDPFLRFHQRLVTLRFIRQHDHAAAWSDAGLTAALMPTLTDLWNGKAVAAGSAVDELHRRGLVEIDPMRLSPAGRDARDQIEAETNRRNAVTWAELADDEAADFLAALRRLPGTV